MNECSIKTEISSNKQTTNKKKTRPKKKKQTPIPMRNTILVKYDSSSQANPLIHEQQQQQQHQKPIIEWQLHWILAYGNVRRNETPTKL